MSSPMFDKHPELAQVMLKYNSRAFQGPVDDTMVWDTLEQLDSYVNMRATYAYPGQLVSVTNYDESSDSEDASHRDASLVVLRADGTRQILGNDTIFESIDDAMSWLMLNAGHAAVPGTVCTIKYALEDGTETYGLFAVIPSGDNFVRVSFNQEDIPEVNWDAIVGNPFDEDEDGKLQYTDKAGEVHKIAYTNDLNKPPVLDAAPSDAEQGSVYYQKI